MTFALPALLGRLLTLTATAAGFMWAPAIADAAYVTRDGNTLRIVEDAPGTGGVGTTDVQQANVITVTYDRDNEEYVVTDSAANPTTNDLAVPIEQRCAATGDTVRCPADGITAIDVEAGELRDVISLDDPSMPDMLTSSVNGGTGIDHLRGLLDGADELIGGDDGDNLSGFGGNDTLTGNQGVDTIKGGAGDDTMRGGAGGDDFRGEDGIDTVDYSTDGTSGVHARINGTPSSGANCADPNAAACEKDIIRTDDVENLIGTTGNDFLYGSDVRNVLDALQGNDTLFGYGGRDDLQGDEGDDLLQGGLANDTLDGGAGNLDYVDYTDRTATADTSDDVTVDLTQTDASNGGAGDGSAGSRDSITNVENVNGGEGDDVLVGKADAVRNVLNGNGGNDFLRGNDGPDTLDGGEGSDWVSYQDDDNDADDTNGGVEVTPGVGSGDDGGADDGTAGSRDTVEGDVENVIGGPDNDSLFGTSDVNVLAGAGASDELNGHGAADHFYGNLPPTLPAPPNAAADGTNDRVSYSNRTSGVTADLDADTDDGNAEDGPAGQRDFIEGATIEGLIGGSGADDLTGNTAANSLVGNGGDDYMRGGLGADSFSGGAQEDTVDYSSDGHTAGIVVTIGNAGTGDGQAGEGDTVPASVENIVGTQFKDEITGELAANKLFGLGGDDTLDGDAGNDLLDGGEGAGDRLFGGPDNDTMHGGSTPAGANDGADVIDGGAGVNTVTYSRLSKVPGVTLAAKLAAAESPDRTAGVTVTLDNIANDGAPGELDHVLLVNHVIGAQGNDTLTGSAAANTLNGMDGDDTLNPGAEGGTPVADVIVGGDGERDRVTYAGRGADNLSITLDGQANDGETADGEQVENDHIHGDVEDVTTVDGNDKVTGETDNDNRIDTAGGNDEIFTRDANADDIACGNGTDTLTADRRDTFTSCETALLPPQPLIRVTGPQSPVGENEPHARFTISMDDIVGQTVTVQYSTSDGTAKAGEDYVARTNQTATIPAGSSQVQVDIPITQDTLDEDAETFNLTISSPTNATLAPGGNTASATIADDDVPPTVSVKPGSVEEGDTGTKTHGVVVELSTASSKDVTVMYSTSDGTAKAGEDYASVTNGTVTIPAGQTTGTADVSIIGDSRDEEAETFTVTLQPEPTNATLGTATATQTITDNDDSPSISIGDSSVGEGDTGDTDLVFPVTLSAASEKTVTVHYEIDAGTAEADDFTDASGDVTFTPGQTESSITVKVKGDTAPEADETVTVTLSNPQNATVTDGLATGTILDDDQPGVSVSDAAITEGDANATFTVTLSEASGRTVTVDYATAAGSAVAPGDYTETSGTLTFAPGETGKTVDVPVKEDALDEANETFALNVSTDDADITDGSGTGTINDDDDPPSLSVADASVTEGDTGAKDLTFTVTQSAASGQAVTVKYATSDGTANAGSDYTATSGTLTIPAGQTSGEVKVPVAGDTVDEPDETLTLTLTEPGNATIADGTATGTITDDEGTPSLSVGDASVTEGNAGSSELTFTVTLSGTSSSDVSVKYATSDGTATAGSDYATIEGTLTIPAGQTSYVLKVPVTGDTTDEPDETLTLALTEPTGATVADGSATGTITDDDQPAVTTPALSVNDIRVAEGDTGTTQAVFTVTLSAPGTGPVSVKYVTSDGTATSGSDYALTAGTLTFAAGERTKTVPVNVIGDRRDEADEAFALALVEPQGATLAKGTGAALITDDETPRVAPRRVIARTTPARDSALPYRFRTSGRVQLPTGVRRSDACAGKVQVRFKAGRKTISTRRANLRRDCTFSRSVSFGIRSRVQPGRLKVQVRFLGNAVLLPKSARTRFVRAG